MNPFFHFSFFFHHFLHFSIFFHFFIFLFFFIFLHFSSLFIFFVFVGCSKSDFFLGLNFVAISLDSSYVKNQFLGPSRMGVGTPLGPLFLFFLLFFSPVFCLFLAFYIFIFYHFLFIYSLFDFF